ncbi:MAG TPA: glycosyltransferase family 2 protein [Casimicrobiaceae bacterium]|nr:glycosyltransferase family 2 protein [Casimicrobiaceae bacterium]
MQRIAERLPLSLVVITRDAADAVAECIRSAAFAAEALVVDSGSRDDTVKIARDCGARVVEHAWLGFGAQKRFAVGEAAHDWVLCLDADERVSPDLAQSIASVFSRPPHAPAYALRRRNRFLGRWLAHGEGYPDWNVRLFDRRRAQWTADPVHEHVVADGPVERLAGDLLHASAESIDEYIAKQNRYTTLQAQAMHARGERAPAMRVALSPLARFLRFYVLKAGFLDGVPGFAHVTIGAFASFMKYVKLRALDERPRPDERER